MFTPHAEVVTKFHPNHEEPEFAAGLEDIQNLLRRRPCSASDVADGLGMHRNEAVKYV